MAVTKKPWRHELKTPAGFTDEVAKFLDERKEQIIAAYACKQPGDQPLVLADSVEVGHNTVALLVLDPLGPPGGFSVNALSDVIEEMLPEDYRVRVPYWG